MVATLQSQEEAIFVDLRSQGGRWELDSRSTDEPQLSQNGDQPDVSSESPEKDHVVSAAKRASRRKRSLPYPSPLTPQENTHSFSFFLFALFKTSRHRRQIQP